MANKKISQLTPKGSALAGTDLLEVSVFNGVTYDTKSLTGANILSGTGLTVGTTAIASGTVGRVLFEGTGNVLQEDAGFIFDSTAKTLTNYGKGGFNSNTSFGVTAGQSNISGIQNSFFGFETLTNNQIGSYNTAMGYTALRNTTGIGYNTAIGWGAGVGVSSGFGNTLLGYGAGSGITTGNNNTIIGVNIATLAAGTTNNVIIADGGGNIAIRKDANHFVGVGYSATATLGAKLDIKAAGALSTDIALRVRNSADSANLFSVQGDGKTVFGNSPSTYYMKSDGDFQFGGLFGYATQLGNIQYNVPLIYIGSTNTAMLKTNGVNNVRFNAASGGTTTGFLWNFASTNLYLGDTNVAFNGNRTLSIENGTAPSASYTDAFQQYSADIVAGNAAPHFRTENGAVVKLYQETTAVAAATFVSNAGTTVHETSTFDGYTLEQVVKALRNTGLLQ